MFVQVACWNCSSCAMLKLWVLGLVRLKVRARPPLQYNSLTLITRPHSLETPTSRYSSSCTGTSGKYFKPFLTQPGSDVIIVLTEPEVYVPNSMSNTIMILTRPLASRSTTMVRPHSVETPLFVTLHVRSVVIIALTKLPNSMSNTIMILTASSLPGALRW